MQGTNGGSPETARGDLFTSSECRSELVASSGDRDRKLCLLGVAQLLRFSDSELSSVNGSSMGRVRFLVMALTYTAGQAGAARSLVRGLLPSRKKSD